MIVDDDNSNSKGIVIVDDDNSNSKELLLLMMITQIVKNCY